MIIRIKHKPLASLSIELRTVFFCKNVCIRYLILVKYARITVLTNDARMLVVIIPGYKRSTGGHRPPLRMSSE